jgi:toxin ParE1/3/4
MTRKYGYLAYYTVDEESEEIVVLTIQHSARDRPFSDA